jgi:hypothetical protein
MRRALISALALLGLAVLPAMAQEAGGLGLSPEALSVGGPRGLARPLPFVFPSIGAGDLQAGSTPAERRQRNRDMVARLRGDGGFIDGFSFGQPRAASRQPPPPPPDFAPIIIDQRTRIVNNLFEGPVAITRGDNNVIQQQGASSAGAVAQQQVATVGERTVRRGGGQAGTGAGSARNLVTPQGNILQSAPPR